ncbi:MAG: ABC transporter ATP-binding protein [Syntrophales bacterium]
MPVLQAGHVSHHFHGLSAVSDFNLILEPEELVGLIGPNGAGKTTVFNLITGIYRASSGSISLNGTEIIGKEPCEIAALGVARTFQNIRLFRELTVLDNVRIAHYARAKYNPLEAMLHLGRFRKEEKAIKEHSLALLALLKLADHAAEPAKNLSYGLQRRLEIARALATEPTLLLLDEPAAGMNPQEVGGLMEFIRWIRTEFKLTILLIEHQMPLVMNICERLLVLDFGVTIAMGLPQEIRDDQRVQEVYLGEAQP